MMQSNDVRWVALGDYIEPCDERNKQGLYMVESVKGISINKIIIETKADMNGVSLTPYKLFKHNEFCFVPVTSRNGEKITIAINSSDETYIVSAAYIVFRIRNEQELLPNYLYLWFCRFEFDRYARFNSWGSARETFSYDDMSRVEIPLPSIERQREMVEVWRGLREMKEENERIAEPLESLCRSYLQDLKYKYPLQAIGPYIETCDEKNVDLMYSDSAVRGLATSKQIIATKANLDGVSLISYKLLKSKEFAFVADTSRRGEKMSLGFNQDSVTYIVSSISTVFKIKDESELLPDYLYLWFCRSEFDRYARFNSWGSAREAFSYDEMTRVEIPIPSIEIQQAIVDIYRCADESRKITAEANTLSTAICPALMQKVING